MSDKVFRCAECGTGQVKKMAKPGRKERYRTMVLEVPGEIEIPTCDHCGAEYLDKNAAITIDHALDEIYRKKLRTRAQRAIRLVTEHIPQGKLEELLGLSHGYLSKLRSGEKDPSTELVAHLALLARDPKSRIGELEQYWARKDEDAA